MEHHLILTNKRHTEDNSVMNFRMIQRTFCFYCFNSGFGAYSMAAFTLDGKDYDDSIDNYRIIYYDSYKEAGTKIFAIVTNPNTGRIIIYAGGSN